MRKGEGVIRFDLKFKLKPPLPDKILQEINFWRQFMFEAHLIGRNPKRYHGLAYGNISHRLSSHPSAPTNRRFIISGTQTGGIRDLRARHYTLVKKCDPAFNRIVAEGPIAPSSEALTHDMIYSLDNRIQWVIHAHHPDIWRHAADLDLLTTSPGSHYGSPALAFEIQRLFQRSSWIKKPLVVMGGHEDGVVSFGRTAHEAGFTLLQTLAEAIPL